MGIKTNKATRNREDELGIGAPTFVSRDMDFREFSSSVRGAYRGPDVATNNISNRKNTDSRFSEDYGGEPLFI